MTEARHLVGGVFTLVTVAFALGCGSTSSSPTPSSAASPRSASDTPAVTDTGLQPVALPDVSNMHPAVRSQLEDAHAAIEAEPSASARSAAYGQLGLLLLAGEELDAAGPGLLNAQRLAPRELRWSYYLGHLYQTQGDLARAIEWFDATLELDPRNLPTLIRLAGAHLDLGSLDRAAPYLERARLLQPDAPVVRFLLGRAAVATQDYATAISHLETALAQAPAATVIHYPLGMAYRGAGNLEKAEHHLGRGGRLTAGGYVTGTMMELSDPLMAELSTALNSPQRFRSLAIQADANGNVTEAARLFRDAVALDPTDPLLQLSLGMALDRAGDPSAAFVAVENATKLDPSLASAHYTLGTLLERGGRDRDAIARFTEAITLGARTPETLLRLADALRRANQTEAALSYYREVMAGPDPAPAADEAARFGEAMALVRLGRHHEARTQLAAAVDRYPMRPVFANALARVLAASPDDDVRDGARAFALVERVVATEKTTAVAETMAMALAEVGQYQGAVEWQRMAIEVAQDAGRRDVAQQMSGNLARYERGEPCRVPWRDDEPEHRPGPIVIPGLLE